MTTTVYSTNNYDFIQDFRQYLQNPYIFREMIFINFELLSILLVLSHFALCLFIQHHVRHPDLFYHTINATLSYNNLSLHINTLLKTSRRHTRRRHGAGLYEYRHRSSSRAQLSHPLFVDRHEKASLQ